MENQEAIISFLETEKILDEAAIKSFVEQQQSTGQSLTSILKQKKVLNEAQMTQATAAGSGIEFVNLVPESIDPMVANLISYETANRYNVIPVRKKDNNLFLAMSSPLNLAARDHVEVKTGYKVVPLAATLSAVKQAIQYHFNVQNVTKQAIISMRLEQDARSEESTDEAQKSAKVTDAPITKLVRSIITGAIDSRASDIHIEPQLSDVKVRYRVDGILRPALDIPLSAMPEVVSHIKIISDMDISERRVPQDGHMVLLHNDREYDLRVSSLPGVTGEKMVMRILDRDVNQWSLDTVVSSPDDRKKFIELVANPNGMILLTGPTGCGKTTTLYSILQLLNKPEDNIVTVEDPVEYRLDGVTQVQVRPAAGMTFASALRSIVRQDPDIILVGEIRDYETAEMAISAALTGHLVLSTLHTKDAAGAISRLANLGVQPFLIASALLGTVAQRLVRTLCVDCAQQYEASEEELNMLFHGTQKREAVKLRRPAGCTKCYQEGYRGRRSIYEILMVTDNIRRMIAEKSSTEAIEQQAIKEGMKTLRDKGLEEVFKGVTSLEELGRVVDLRAE
jgi:type IV pilus assembly protein PilB